MRPIYIKFFRLFKSWMRGLGLMGAILTNSSCKKFITVDPPTTQLTGASVYTSDATAIAVVTGMYVNLNMIPSSTGLTSMSYFPGLSADELSVFPGSSGPLTYFYSNGLTSNNIGTTFWNNAYSLLFTINSSIEGLSSASGLTPRVKQQLLGEAKFMRAFCYFYLVNLYGDVPLQLSSDYNLNGFMARTPKAQVYGQIVADLKEAQGALSSGYLDASLLTTSTERVRPNAGVASALLARVYLYLGNLNHDAASYASAEMQSGLLIGNTGLYRLTNLDSTFFKNTTEAIWQLQPISTSTVGRTGEANLFILPASGNYTNKVYLDSLLVNAFEAGDLRKTKWTASINVSGKSYYYAYKYKGTGSAANNAAAYKEYSMVLRLGEQYLIRAEARASQGNVSGATGAIADLNIVRHRAGLPDYGGATDQASVLSAIMHERQVELFTEWGHRWLDLKRTGSIDAVMNDVCPKKGTIWQSYQQLYPIPFSEVQKNLNLRQNPNY